MNKFDDGDVTRRITDCPRRRSSVSPVLVGVIVVLSLCVGALFAYLIVRGKDNPAPATASAPVIPDEVKVSDSRPAHTADSTVGASPSTPAAEPWHRLAPASANCDVCLAPQAGNTYYARNLLDGNPATAWAATLDEELSADCETFDGPTFSFSQPVEIKRIKIRNGYCKSDKSFRDNARVGYVRIYGYTVDPRGKTGIKLLWSGRLEDSRELQTLDVEEPYGDERITGVFTSMDCRDNSNDYYPGNKYADICLSDFEFWGR